MFSSENLLPGGRKLAWAEYGVRDGYPIIFFHGIPGSRLFFELGDDAARKTGVRLIAPDRPGFGASHFVAGRRILDWPGTVELLANHLRLEKFSVAGLSGGGPYALACGATIPHRLDSMGIISGMGPVNHPRVRSEMIWRQSLALWLFRDSPMFLPLLSRIFSGGLSFAPGLMIQLASMAPEPGREILKMRKIRCCLVRSMKEAFRAGPTGVVWDLRLILNDWGFDLRRIDVPAVLWHGLKDFDVPQVLGRVVASSLSNCVAEFLPNSGHTLVLYQWLRILHSIKQSGLNRKGLPDRVLEKRKDNQ